MSGVPQRRIVRGPAKIIPFPARNVVQAKPPRTAKWIYWLVFLMIVTVAGEIWSTWVKSTPVEPASLEHNANPSRS